MNNSENVKHDQVPVESESDDRLENSELSIEDIRFVTGGAESSASSHGGGCW